MTIAEAAVTVAPFDAADIFTTDIFTTVMILLGIGLMLLALATVAAGRRGEAKRDAKALDLTPMAENPETKPWRRK